ncbi:MAG: DUF1700 domain-containing protein [Clostridia bacterium]|nr:DUF1700 domain-containing protein [Clostridia bacterium]
MNKQEFIAALQAKLSGLPEQEVKDRIDFYIEMIDDRTEDGCTEEEAVRAIGSVEEVASQIIADIPLSKIAKERIKPKSRLKAWEIVLLALGSPIWLSLAIAAFAVILSLYVVLWSVIVSLWSVFASLAACAFGFIAGGVILTIYANGATGIILVSAGIVCAGLSIFSFFGCRAATKGICRLTPKIALGIKRCFAGKENVQ